MKRKFIEKLLFWKENEIRTPLLVRGARQIGKTYIIDEFCKANFKNYVYLNFENTSELSTIFEKTIEPKEIIRYIEATIGKPIDIENTIIFFDEIQVSERAITSLKYFCEAEENYKIVCAGSLLGVKINRFNSSFPVGKVRILEMYPMDFEEFLLAIGEDALLDIINKCYEKNEAMVEILHNKAIKCYQDYLIIGGMPQAVLNYIKNDKDVIRFDKVIHESIITAYIADMRKYTMSAAETIKMNDIYNSIPRQLSKDNTKFKYNIIKQTANKRDYELPLDWLLSAGLIYKSTKIDKTQTPLKAYLEQSHFKIYLNDVGLLSTLAGVSYKDILLSENNIFKGALTENYIAQTLKANEVPLYYFKPSQNMEIDFVISQGNAVIPIEVKSGSHVKATSLKAYLEKYKAEYGIRISSKNFGMNNKILSIPLYAAYLIGKSSTI